MLVPSFPTQADQKVFALVNALRYKVTPCPILVYTACVYGMRDLPVHPPHCAALSPPNDRISLGPPCPPPMQGIVSKEALQRSILESPKYLLEVRPPSTAPRTALQPVGRPPPPVQWLLIRKQLELSPCTYCILPDACITLLPACEIGF